MAINKLRFLCLTSLSLIISGCSSFTGIRTPLYDGEPFIPQEEEIAAYNESREILGETKELYLPETFSEDILKPSIDYIDHEPILLEEGTYTVGVDIPASRVTLFGEKNDPSMIIDFNVDPFAPAKPEEYEVGTMTIRDENGHFYFENMFHKHYGVLVTQVDFIEGHTIEIIGNNPKVVVFFDEVIPEDPYIFDTRWEDYIAGLEAEGIELVEHSEEDLSDIPGIDPSLFIQEQPIVISEEEQTVNINAGIYEVGVHLEAGTYEVTEESVPNHTAMYLFRDHIEPKVIDISKNIYGVGHNLFFMNSNQLDEDKPIIELIDGDKIYPHYVGHMLLTKIDE